MAASPSAVVGPAEENTAEGLAAFARRIDEALAKGDVAVLIERLRGPDVRFYQWGQPVTSIPLDRSAPDLTRLLTGTRAGDRDSYGMAAPKVWWVGQDLATPNLVITAISRDEATTYRRLAVVLLLKFCDAGCAGGSSSRWTVTGVVVNWGGEGFLRPGDDFFAAFGRIGELYRRPVALTQDIRDAAAAVAKTFGQGVKATPNCTPDAVCIETYDPGVAVDLGIMRLSLSAPQGEGGSAAVFAGRTASGAWDFWYGTQQTVYRMADLPGDILVCANGDGLNIRQKPDTGSAAVGFVKDLTRLRAEEFVLTTPGGAGPGSGSGSGWYRVTSRDPQVVGWVFSKYTTDARLKDCSVRDAVEGTR